ncbi:MAG: hypothetical protein JXR59_02330 [Desulfuromonadaceae bacterium]|nr:hypothetical protein [Desulfuromonadaceae bacterium]
MYQAGEFNAKAVFSAQSLIDDYRNYYRARTLFVETTSGCTTSGRHLRLELSAGNGNGWVEMVQISHGLTVGLCDYHLKNFCLAGVLTIAIGGVLFLFFQRSKTQAGLLLEKPLSEAAD